MTLADVVKNLSEQLQQVQSHVVNQRDALHRQHVEQARRIDALNAKVVRLERQWRASECFKDDGNVCCSSTTNNDVGYIHTISVS